MTRRSFAGWMVIVCAIALVGLVGSVFVRESKRGFPPSREALIKEVAKLRKEKDVLETRLGYVWIAAAESGITVNCNANVFPETYYVGNEEFALVKFLATDEGESDCTYFYPEKSKWGRPDLSR